MNSIREALAYNPDTGIFNWKIDRRGSVKAGDVAGREKNGYWTIKFAGKEYYAHRLAWFFVMDAWPENEIDHVDGERMNNRFTNLREASRNINMHNLARPMKNNRTGFLGVVPFQGRFRAQIKVDKVSRVLGSYDTPELAHAAYLRAKNELHPTHMRLRHGR